MSNSYDDDDEDVVYAGSPVYESLMVGHRQGGLEFDVYSRSEPFSTPMDIQRDTPCDAIKRTGTKSTPLRQKMTQMYMKWLKLFGILDAKEITQFKAVEIIECVIKSANMEEGDIDFLQAYLKIPQLSKPPGSLRRWLAGLSLMVFPVMCAFGLFKMNRLETEWRWLLGNIILTSTSVITMPLVLLFFLNLNKSSRRQRKLDDEHQIVQEHIRIDEGFSTALKKSLRLIQEKELIARGFTLVSQKNPICRLEEGRSLTAATRQCPGLRKLVFMMARHSIYFYRDTTRELINLAGGSECDVRSSYLSYEPLQSYGPCLQPSLTEDSHELYTITDGFSVSALKGIYHLLQLHQSEFLKTLALVYNHSLQNTDLPTDLPTEELVSLLQTTDYKLQDWLETVKESYDFHNCSLLSRKSNKKEPSPSSDIADIQTAVHSLDLHLQSALTRVQTFSTWLETKAGGKLVGCEDIVKNIMEPIRAELDSCKGCWEETNIRIEKLMGRSNENTMGDPSDAAISLEEKELQVAQSTIPEDYIIVDQVFEAYTDPNELNDEENGWDKPLTAEEKEKLQREKHEALRMLTELKSVISVRAVDMEKRERAALLRAHPEMILNPADCTEAENDDTLNQAGSTGSGSQTAGGSVDNPGHKNIEKCTNDPSLQQSNPGSDLLNTKGDETDSQIEYKSNEKLEENMNRPGLDIDVIYQDRNPLSYVNYQGVRRLRKSNMLDLSDSDSDAEITRSEEKFSDKLNGEEEETKHKSSLGLPFIDTKNSTVHEGCVDSCDSDKESQEDIGDYSARQPLSFKERLSQLSGANLHISSSIASQAVAKSLAMGVLTESTFGGEVFGELSSSDSENES